MALTYTTLVAEIKTYLENDFDTADIDTIIQQAEQRIYNSVQLPAFRKNVVGNLTASNKYLTLPSDFLAPFSLSIIDIAAPTIGVQTFLLNKDVSFMREAYPDPSVTGKPVQYAIFDATSLIVGPTPDQAYGAELHYYFYPESIVTANTTWLGTNFETALLYGCLVEGYTFMKGEADLIAMYDKKYGEAIMLLKQLGDGKDRRDSYRSGQLRLPVQ